MLLQLLFVYALFMNHWFNTTAVTLHDWLLSTGVRVAIFLVVEGEKAVLRWVRGKSRQLERRKAGRRQRFAPHIRRTPGQFLLY